MANRKMEEYVGITKSVTSNKQFSKQSENNATVNPKPTIYHTLGSFLTKDWWNWVIHNFSAASRYPNYPEGTAKSIYNLKSANGLSAPVTIALAADWGSDTEQSEYVADQIRNKKSDYTIHMGDIYYSGNNKEINTNYDPALWPRGNVGTFALLGNHEMFSGGASYFNYLPRLGETDAVTKQPLGQEAPFFCLKSDHWCILGLDTGYDSLKGPLSFHPDDTNLEFQEQLTDWLDKVVDLKNEKRGIIVLTHHQYVSAFKGEDNFLNPAKTLQSYFGTTNRKILWIWGHEHRFSIYGKFQESPEYITAYGRCIGNGGLCDEHTDKRTVIAREAKKYNLILYDHRVADTIQQTELGYNGYALITINGAQADIGYYAAYNNPANGVTKADHPIITESWTADKTTGDITCINIIDELLNVGKGELTYINTQTNDPEDAGRP